MRIRSFRHKGVRRLYQSGDRAGVSPKLLVRITDILAIIEAVPQVTRIETFPGLRLHRLRGDRAGWWSVSVSGNWRMIFRVDGDEVVDLDLVDYH
ncbi:MAG TPA: type II toxin-antitoxin system RelE/ParE family toxin [Xanthobacteraceae bacterium]